MPYTPSPTPTAAQLATVKQITMLPLATVKAMVEDFELQADANAAWTLALAAIADWPAYRDETGDIKRVGPIEFMDGRSVNSRLEFRNALRALYDQPLLMNEKGVAAAMMAGFSGSASVVNEY